MRAVIQRVSRGQVTLSHGEQRSIGSGLVLLVAITHNDDEGALDWIVRKVLQMRIFDDDDNSLNRSLLETGGEILLVSQFTLYGDTRKGNRPSFTRSAPPEVAIPLYEQLIQEFRAAGVSVQTGEFGDRMQVEIVGEGPVTLLLDSDHRSRHGDPF